MAASGSGAKAFSLNDTLLIALLTVGGYAFVAMFESGMLRYYGLSSDLNRPDIMSVFNVLAKFNVGVAASPINWLLVLPLVALIWPGCFVIGVRDAVLQKFPRVAAAPCLLSFVFMRQVMAPWHVILYIGVGTYIALMIRNHIVLERHGTWRARDSDDFWQQNLSPRIEITTFRTALVALALLPVAYFLGYESPSKSNELYLTRLQDDKGVERDFAVVSMTSDDVIGIRLDRGPHDGQVSFTHSVGALKLPRGTVIQLSTCKISERTPMKPLLLFTYPAQSPLMGQILEFTDPAHCPNR